MGVKNGASQANSKWQTWPSSVRAGHPKTEIGNSAEENHVSSTSSSCCSVNTAAADDDAASGDNPRSWAAFSRASASVRATTQRSRKEKRQREIYVKAAARRMQTV